MHIIHKVLSDHYSTISPLKSISQRYSAQLLSITKNYASRQ